MSNYDSALQNLIYIHLIYDLDTYSVTRNELRVYVKVHTKRESMILNLQSHLYCK